MLSPHSILSVAKYESRILARSWFFRIFAILSVLFLFGINMNTISEVGGNEWSFRAIPSSIPYLNLLFLNITQSIIAIFLSSEFLRRDKKLDTSVVFYVRPPSNAEYILGKTWGNLTVFLGLIFISLVLTLIFNLVAQDSYVEPIAYLQYFLLLSLPTLLFIMGLAFVLMLLLNNQALTFVLMLGYTGMMLFYVKSKFYGIFDFAAFQFPMFKSDITGFGHVRELLLHRGLYLFLGLGGIAYTIGLFKRLPNNPAERPIWMFIGTLLAFAGLGCGVLFVADAKGKESFRAEMVSINNKYVDAPLFQVTDLLLKVEQLPNQVSATARLTGVAAGATDFLVFTLNPGLTVTSVKSGSTDVQFKRESQILEVKPGRTVQAGDTLSFDIAYEGTIDESLAYLDQPTTVLRDRRAVNMMMINHDKRYAFQEPDYVLFTPELYWYPRSGTSYSDQNSDWNHVYFSRFQLEVKPRPGLMPVSQGASEEIADGWVRFTPSHPMPGLTLAVGNYEKRSLTVDSLEFSIFSIKGHDTYSGALDQLKDTLSVIIGERMADLSRNIKLDYCYPRFSIVEVPAHYTFYARTWTMAQECMQPEMVLFPEKGFSVRQSDLKGELARSMKMAQRFGESLTEKDYQLRIFRNVIEMFANSNSRMFFGGGNTRTMGASIQQNPYYIYPQFYSFKYNIASAEWPIANYLLESYLQRGTAFSPMEFMRNANGITDEEKVNVLLKKQSMAELLNDTSKRSLVPVLVGMKSEQLFAHGERAVGVDTLKKVIYAILDENRFQNVPFESFLNRLREYCGADLLPVLKDWYTSTKVPYYFIGTSEIYRISGLDEDLYELTIRLENASDVDGMVKVNVSFGGGFSGGGGGGGRMAMFGSETESRVIFAGARESLEVVYHFLAAPRNITLNTMISQNLPVSVSMAMGRAEQVSRSLKNEAEYVVTQSLNTALPGEIIVDNEDPGFSVSAPELSGLLQRWLLKEDPLDDGIKFKGYTPWRPPFYWTPITNSGCYGLFIRSSSIVKSGSGNQTATWTAFIPESGRYDLFYHVYRDESLRQNRGRGGQAQGGQGQQRGGQQRGSDYQDGEYAFKVLYGELSEDAFLDIEEAEDGWNPLGTYDLPSDSVRVILSNKTELRTVNADAIKFVRKQL